MTDRPKPRDEFEDLPAGMPARTLGLLLLAALGGVLAALVVLPWWLPGLSGSLVGSSPKGFWYLSRASAWVAFVLLWASMALGLAITNRLARVWPGGPTAFDLHQHVSLLALAFSMFHGLVLLGDRYVGYTLVALALPFASQDYRPIAVGVGQVAFYTLALVSLSFYVRQRIGRRIWRLIHFLSFAVFVLALAHGMASGTDSGAAWARMVYWTSSASVLFLTVYRVLVSSGSAAHRPERPPVGGRTSASS
jgi:predicted ferric reductase